MLDTISDELRPLARRLGHQGAVWFDDLFRVARVLDRAESLGPVAEEAMAHLELADLGPNAFTYHSYSLCCRHPVPARAVGRRRRSPGKVDRSADRGCVGGDWPRAALALRGLPWRPGALRAASRAVRPASRTGAAEHRRTMVRAGLHDPERGRARRARYRGGALRSDARGDRERLPAVRSRRSLTSARCDGGRRRRAVGPGRDPLPDGTAASARLPQPQRAAGGPLLVGPDARRSGRAG